jgi:hypothetical protein
MGGCLDILDVHEMNTLIVLEFGEVFIPYKLREGEAKVIHMTKCM